MQTSDKVSDPENEDNQTPTNYFSLPVLERPNSSKLHLKNSEATCTFCTSLEQQMVGLIGFLLFGGE